MANKQSELAKNTIILTVGKICTQFVSFLLLPLYTALLLPEEYGVVDLFNTYIMLLVPVFNWQFESGLFRFMLDCRNDKTSQKKIFSTVLLSNVVQSVIYSIFFVVAQGYISSEYKIFLLYDVILNIFLNTLLQLPRGIGDNTKYAIGSFVSASSTVVLNVLFIAGFRMGAYGMFWATVLGKAITICYLTFSLKVWSLFSCKLFDINIFKEIGKYSLPLVPNQLSWWVIGVSDRTIVSYGISIAANGIYSIANKFSSIFITFYNIFNMSWTESVSLHMNDSDRDAFLSDTINTMFKLFSAVCLGIIACMPFLFPFLIDKKYADAYNQIPILMIAVLFQVVVGLYSVIYVALKKSVEIAKTSMYAAIINIGMDIILIKWLGLYAASLSTLFAYVAMALYRYYDVKKYVDVSLNKKTIAGTIAIGFVAVASYYSKVIVLEVASLLVITIYAVLMNRKLLMATYSTVVQKLKKKGRN